MKRSPVPLAAPCPFRHHLACVFSCAFCPSTRWMGVVARSGLPTSAHGAWAWAHGQIGPSCPGIRQLVLAALLPGGRTAQPGPVRRRARNPSPCLTDQECRHKSSHQTSPTLTHRTSLTTRQPPDWPASSASMSWRTGSRSGPASARDRLAARLLANHSFVPCRHTSRTTANYRMRQVRFPPDMSFIVVARSVSQSVNLSVSQPTSCEVRSNPLMMDAAPFPFPFAVSRLSCLSIPPSSDREDQCPEAIVWAKCRAKVRTVLRQVTDSGCIIPHCPCPPSPPRPACRSTGNNAPPPYHTLFSTSSKVAFPSSRRYRSQIDGETYEFTCSPHTSARPHPTLPYYHQPSNTKHLPTCTNHLTKHPVSS